MSSNKRSYKLESTKALPPEFRDEHDRPMRLQKFLARAGVASRRGSENLMTAGRVKVNGRVVTELGFKVDPLVDIVEVDDIFIKWQDDKVWIMLNKPAGYVSTMKDPHARKTVAQLVPIKDYPGLFPVGRLDMDTTGLLLFSTDGEISHRLLSPAHHVMKVYEAIIKGTLLSEDINALCDGVLLDDGMTLPAKVRVIEQINYGAELASLVEISLTEGRKRQVKRMFEHVGHPVLKLHRKAFGSIYLGDLEEGKYRKLTTEEIESLKEAVSDSTK